MPRGAPLRPALLLAAAAALLAAGRPAAAEEPVKSEKPRFTNRLAKEKSPYLLQHAHNPVDWYPWGPEAFERARKEEKPIFLSIGYSTCHWCHVMERESFEDEGLAKFLNENFVPVKVDREERPDVDAVYMAAVQATGQGGGWPLSAFLSPDGKPFFLGTYFPPEDRYGRPGFRTVLHKVLEAWRTRREDVLGAGAELARAVARGTEAEAPGKLGPATLELAARQLAERFDPVHAGFGDAPKFPRAFVLELLLRAAGRSGAPALRDMATATLDRMARGGMYDQVGGGFHRYSTDAEWLVPHFEKMLYDQALLAEAYVEGFLVTGDAAHARIARETLDYCLRDLRHREGGFFAAEDADSEGVEGKFYLWTRAEVLEVLGKEEGEAFARVHGVRAEGNFRGEAEAAPAGSNILHLPRTWEEAARDGKTTAAALRERMGAARARLLAVRARRVRPHLDDKVLAGWNGLMVSALARAARALEEPRYAEAAGRAADFVLTRMRRDGRLLRRFRDGEAGIPAYLEDHAFLALGLLDLYGATYDPARLAQAREVAAEMLRRFGDPAGGGLWTTASDAEPLLARPREGEDWAVPSGNSAAALLLLRLGRLTADPETEEAGRGLLRAFSGPAEKFPMAHPFLLLALDFDLGPGREVVLAGDPASEGFRALDRVLARRHLPRVVVAAHPTDPAAAAAIEALVPYLKDYRPVDGKAAAYVCRGGSCRAPVTTPEALAAALR